MIKKTVSGEGESARDALEAFAFGLKDHEVDEAAGKCIVVHLKRAKVKPLRDAPEYDGFSAEVVKGEVPAYTDKEIVQEIRRRVWAAKNNDDAAAIMFWIRMTMPRP